MRRQVIFILSIMWTSLLFSEGKDYGTTVDVMDLVIEAPADTTITATMRGCWGMVVLDSAEVISHLCGGPIRWTVETPFDTINTNGGKLSFRLGTHEVRFIAMDDCGNTARDTTNVTVIDSIPPIAHCVDLRTISLDGSGMAFIPAAVFNDGSEESCFTFFKVRRLVDDTNCVNPSNPDNLFDDVVKFCCTDIGDTVQVILKVYDRMPNSGPVPLDTLDDHADTCIALALVLDKAPPVLVCPDDITIECGDHIDFDTLGLPTFTDNCDSIRFESFIEKDIDQCGTGEFRRVIVGIDAGGQTDTCIQTITVVNNFPFDGTDTTQLKWPEEFVTVYDCLPVPDTSVTGRPIIYEDQCSMVSVSFKDEVYQFSRGACSKVIRKWKAIDWCQYDPKVSSVCEPGNGCWTFDQIIKVIDTIAPIITRPNDTIVAYQQAGCDSMLVDLDSATTDRCYVDEEIILSVSIDLFKDGSIDRQVTGGDASGYFPLGAHWVIYIATDACGNTTRDTMNLEVKDRTLPTPISKLGLNTSLIDMGGGLIMVSVDISLLNASSYDNCTASEDLKFSYSRDTNDVVRTYDCDSIGSRKFELWVTDECGNQDFAQGFILIEDVLNLCPTTSSLTSISGVVARNDGMLIKGAGVQIEPQNGNPSMAFSNEKGVYSQNDLNKNENYKITPSLTNDLEEGLTTKDLILIQRFLLGKVDFDNVYQHMAADADKSGSISARDITELRKLLLGKSNELSHGQGWVFMPEGYQFQDPDHPLDEYWPESYSISNLKDPVAVNFTGYKLGDVDMSFGLTSTGTRSNSVLIEKIYDSEGVLHFKLKEEAWVEGVQLEVILQGIEESQIEVSSELEAFGTQNYHYASDGSLRVIWNTNSDLSWMAQGADLLRIKSLDGNLQGSMSLENFEPLIFTDQGDFDLQIDKRGNEVNMEALAIPNPFSDKVTVRVFSPEESMGTISVRNVIGQTSYSEVQHLNVGWNEIELGEKVFESNGLYFIYLKTGQGQCELKVVKGL